MRDSFLEMIDNWTAVDQVEGAQCTRGPSFPVADLRATTSAIVVTNRKGLIIDACQQAHTLFACDRDELIGSPLHERIVDARSLRST